jgi:hypothetical protein
MKPFRGNTANESANKGLYRAQRVPRAFFAFFGCRCRPVMFRPNVLAFSGLWARDRRPTVPNDDRAVDYWPNRLYMRGLS